MKTLVLISLMITGIAGNLIGQTSADALRYSRIFYGGTARFTGLSGAFTAVGADASVMATNPAGIGLFQSAEVTLTFAPSISNSTADYNGSISSDFRVNFGMGNLGVIISIKPYNKYKSSALRNFNFGIGFNRQSDFSNRTYIYGLNNTSSLMTSYVDKLNADHYLTPYDYPFDIALAYDANLIGYDSLSGSYYCDAPNGGVTQSKLINTSGSINELDIAFGGNINDKLYFGLTIGVPTIRYYESSQYVENKENPSIPNFLSLSYNYGLQTRGTGVNFKLGLIYRPLPWFRVGASIHTPTWYPSLQDEWFSNIHTTFTRSDWNSSQYSPVGNYNYRLMTPFRAMGGLAFIIGQYGLFSADYEYVNYGQARFSASDDFSTLNREIQNKYQSWGNVRLGTEWRIQNFRLRGGFAYFSNPYKQNINNSERYQASGGFGYRSKHFFADVTYVWSQMKEDYYLYDPALVNPSHNTNTTHTVLTTVGIRF